MQGTRIPRNKMWAKLTLIVWQHFIFASASDSATHETTQAGFSTDVSTFLSENSSTTFSFSTPLTTTLQNATAFSTKLGRSSEEGAETKSTSSSLGQTFFSNTSHPTSTVLSTAAMNLTFQNNTAPNATAVPTTIAPNATSNSSVIVTSYSPNITNSSLKGEITTSTTDNPLTNSTAQTTSLHSFAGNSSFTSGEPTSLTNSIGYREVTAIKVSTATFTKPDASTTLLSSSSKATLLSKSPSNNSTEGENRFAAPGNAGEGSTADYRTKIQLDLGAITITPCLKIHDIKSRKYMARSYIEL
ncbi:uncharacterized protein LOC127569550 isoform X2 [Pristis pectinata]|uniref:uncharacterized protein LOC127569550 isoform X2 n=1 Tax=Pristis pectinata TaxID=685728 RepID=UPI00223E5B80|nr:uncharacterized protein LOC127569550 isoform X2 [Pristis pectinata]